jgi:hypothetical protein
MNTSLNGTVMKQPLTLLVSASIVAAAALLCAVPASARDNVDWSVTINGGNGYPPPQAVYAPPPPVVYGPPPVVYQAPQPVFVTPAPVLQYREYGGRNERYWRERRWREHEWRERHEHGRHGHRD